MGSKNFQIFAQNSYVLVDGFIEISQSASKMDRNSVFLGRDPHILDR
jgi:hypothetical protein